MARGRVAISMPEAVSEYRCLEISDIEHAMALTQDFMAF